MAAPDKVRSALSAAVSHASKADGKGRSNRSVFMVEGYRSRVPG